MPNKSVYIENTRFMNARWGTLPSSCATVELQQRTDPMTLKRTHTRFENEHARVHYLIACSLVSLCVFSALAHTIEPIHIYDNRMRVRI